MWYSVQKKTLRPSAVLIPITWITEVSSSWWLFSLKFSRLLNAWLGFLYPDAESIPEVAYKKSLSWSYLAYFVLKNNFTRLGESLVWPLNLGISRPLILKQEVVLTLRNFFLHKKASPLSAVCFSRMTQSHGGCLAEMFWFLFPRLNPFLRIIYWIYCLDCWKGG